MSLYEVPVPPTVPKPEGRNMKCGLSLVPIVEENSVLPALREKSSALDRSLPLRTSLQSKFIPEEILYALTSTVKVATRAEILGPSKKNKGLKDMKVVLQKGVRNTDPLWHHPGRRGRFKHLTDQPICLTGAGRDISFLCDAVMAGEKNAGETTCAATQRDGENTTDQGTQDSLIPEEFHIVKNRGVMGLEYYEDKYTTLLEDREKRLMVFPSMKPNGRAEVLQLMKVMDTMLQKTGVDEQDLGRFGPTQMHNLLELLKTEQNIYNVVFHELIRQVSVECAERGELLSKIRQRYVNLLDRIPHQVQSLHNDMMAQRAVNRRLTDEVVHFKNSIGNLISELCQFREHDLRVSKEANYAREELAMSLEECEKNGSMLNEYRELYELQRQRLEAQLAQLTEERDLWSLATYKLAEKVIEDNRLHLARRLYMSEKSWTKVIRHFTVVVASKDTMNLSQIQQVTECWRELMLCFGQEVERAEESSREKLLLLRGDLEKWQQYFQENLFDNSSFRGVPCDVMDQILQDLKSWENMMAKDLERFGGDVLLTNLEKLKLAGEIQHQWTELAQEVLQRHCSLDGDLPPEQRVMEELNVRVQELCLQYTCRVDGENGVARLLTGFISSLETWTFQLQAIWGGPHGMPESEWQKFYLVLPDWMEQVDRALKLIGTSQSEESLTEGTLHEHLVPGDVSKMLQDWITAMTSGAEKDDLHLTQEVTSLHTAMVQWMVNLLIFLASKYASSNTSIPPAATDFPDEDRTTLGTGVEELVEDARILSQKLSRFSSYMVSSCQEMVDKISQEKKEECDADPNFELRQLESVKTECNEWIETCQLILSEIRGCQVKVVTESQSRLESTEVCEDGMPTPKSPLPHTAQGPLHRDSTRDQPETPQIMSVIGHDSTIKRKPLTGEEVLVSKESMMTAIRPETQKSCMAFETLATMEQLHQQLLQTELRAQKAEEAVESLDEQLKNALERIQEMEKQMPAESKTVVTTVATDEKPIVEESDKGGNLSNKAPTPPRQRKQIKSSKAKH